MTEPKVKTIDYTKMRRGTVTRTYKGRRVAVIATCPKCGKFGERSVSIPDPRDAIARHRPYVHVTHKSNAIANPAEVRSFFGNAMHHVTESCMVSLDKTNADELLNVEETKRYRAFADELHAYADQF